MIVAITAAVGGVFAAASSRLALGASPTVGIAARSRELRILTVVIRLLRFGSSGQSERQLGITPLPDAADRRGPTLAQNSRRIRIRGRPVAVGGRLDDPPEPGLLEHRGEADVAEADVDPAALGIDRIGLDARRSGPPGEVDDAVEQRAPRRRAAGSRRGRGSRRSTRPAGRRPSGSSASGRGAAGWAAARTRTSRRPRRRRRRACPAADPRSSCDRSASPPGARLAPAVADRPTARRLAPAAAVAVAAQDRHDVGPAVRRRRDDLDRG